MTLLNPFFGEFGGMYVPQILIPALLQLEKAFVDAQEDPAFIAEFQELLTEYAGRPTPLTLTRNLTKGTKTRLYLKREDLLDDQAKELPADEGEYELRARLKITPFQHGSAAPKLFVSCFSGCAYLPGDFRRPFGRGTSLHRRNPPFRRCELSEQQHVVRGVDIPLRGVAAAARIGPLRERNPIQ